MNKVIIFGLQDFAELAHYYLVHDSKFDVVAFTVNEKYLPVDKMFRNLPVVPFEGLESEYSKDDYYLFAPMSPKGMNKIREKVYLEGKAKGYQFISYISSKASRFGNTIGENCFILEDNTLQPFASIGNNVVMWSGNHIGHHGLIKDHVSFTSHVVLSGHCIVEPYSFFGVNATIRDGLTIAEGTLIGMGACVTKNTKPWSVYVGAPATLLEGKDSTKFL